MGSTVLYPALLHRFRGPDLDSAIAAEPVAIAGRIDNAFRRPGPGWSIFVEAQRSEAATYPDNPFPNAASGLVEEERKADFAEVGIHFVSDYFLTILYQPSAEDAARPETWLYEGLGQTAGCDRVGARLPLPGRATGFRKMPKPVYTSIE
ncbi:hypothetical protein LA66_15940 [Aureimonas altamirensis]|uniref:Uncharacterized protein n=1 Tax=Aureimonas altamirensis TaxID=370622 RepID=A0A0B1Q5D2_9HYPH|nr:hypothetical protein LA66_15940 [Aureimonas altamirensis]